MKPRNALGSALLFFGTITIVAAASPSPPQGGSTGATARVLFGALRGHWACEGAFANGRKISSDLRFAPAMDGGALHFEHRDRAPSSYLQQSTWGYDSSSRRILSMALAGTVGGATATPALFSAESWTDSSITLRADTLTAPPFAPNHFIYAMKGRNTLTVRWERERNGEWVLGDSLTCARSARADTARSGT